MIVVNGSIIMSNGESPEMLMVYTGRTNLLDCDYVFRIVGEQITIEFNNLPDKPNINEIFRTARQLCEGVILPLIINNGISLSFIIRGCWTKDGEYYPVIPDQTDVDKQYDSELLSSLVSRLPYLRYAVRDFNQGLICREDCHFYFYRAIENLARQVTAVRGQLSPEDWNRYHNSIGVLNTEIKLIESKTNSQNSTSSLTREEHESMLASVQRYFNRSIYYLITVTRP